MVRGPAPTPPEPSDISTIVAAIAAISLAGIGMSLTLPLLSIRMDMAGYSSASIGVNTALSGVANVIGAPLIPWLAGRFGMRRLLAGAVGLAMLVLAGFAVLPIPAWFPLRFLFGAAIATLFVVSEFWIMSASRKGRRGLVTGIYATTLALGFAVGPALLRLTGTDGAAPFLVGIALFAAAALPIALAGQGTPQLDRHPTLSLAALVRAAPLATLAAFAFGVFETTALSLLPVYALRLGLTSQDGATLVSLAAFGNVAFQIPLGLLGDRVPRLPLLAACGAVGAMGAVGVLWAGVDPTWLGLVVFVWSGVVSGLYTLGLASVGDRYVGSDLASANSTMVTLYALGLMVGPPVLGQAMDVIGPSGLPLGLLLVFTGYTGLAAWWLLVGRRRRVKS